MEVIIKAFLEDNWDEFLTHCRQHGIEDESEVDDGVDDVLGK